MRSELRCSVFSACILLLGLVLGQNALHAQTLSVSDASGAEGGDLTFTVTLSGSPGNEVTVDYATSVETGDTAVQADFTDTSGTLTFASGASGSGLSQTFTVAAADDALAEGAETFTVTLSAPSTGFPSGVSINDATGVGTISASDPTTLKAYDAQASEGTNVFMTVRLFGSPGAEVTVDYATSIESGDTAELADFTSASGTLTFAAGATGGGLSQTIAVAAVDDDVAEGWETFSVTLTEPSGGFPPGVSIGDATGTGTIFDNDVHSLTVSDASGAEGGDVTFTVTLSGSPGNEVTVDYATSVETGDTAVQADFTDTSGTLTFASGASGSGLSQTFTVAATDDDLAEGPETFTVTLTAPSGGLAPQIRISDGTGRGTIGTSDPATLSVSDASGAEGTYLTFTVTLSGRPGNEVYVNYATTIGGSDTAEPADFWSTSGTLTFADGATDSGLAQTFRVLATQDDQTESAETFTVTLTAFSLTQGVSIGDGTGTGTITASDLRTLSVGDASGAEGTNLTFTVGLSGSPPAEVTVDYATSIETGDTAVQADFTDTSGTLTFASDASGSGLSQTFTVATADDAVPEGAETFTVTLTAPSGGLPSGVSLGDGTGVGTIDASDVRMLSVSDAAGTEGTDLTFTVTLSGSPPAEVTVDYETSVGSGDTAVQADFTDTSGTLTFASGASGSGLSQTFTVAAADDALAEGAETFTVTLTAPSGGLPPGIAISDGTGTGTIGASDAATLSVDDASGAEGSDLTFTVTLSGSPSTEVTVDYATSVGSGDTAVQADFTDTSGTLTFASGASGAALSQTFTVATADDSLAEGAETFTVTLTAPSGGLPPGIAISDGTGTGTIGASDAATLSVDDASGAEGSDLTFTVTLSGSPGAEVTVDYATSVGGSDTAVQSDFTDTSGTLTFASGASGSALSQTFTVAAANDTLAEGAETFTVTLTAPSGGLPPGVSMGDGTGTGTIGASDAATLSVSDASGAEGGSVTFTVTLSGSPSTEVTVDYATSVGSGDTAVQADFTDTSGTLTFASGASGSGLSKTFAVAVADDSLAEGAETFTVTLTAPPGGLPSGVSISDGTGTGTIGASDAATLSVSDASGAEGGSVTFTVTLSGSPSTEVTVDYATSVGSGDTAVQADFTDTSGTLTFASGASGAALSQTFTVATAHDSLAEGAETFTVTLSAPSGGFPSGISISDGTGTGTITASDAATLSVSDATGGEGGDLTFTVTLSGSPGAEVTVDYETSIESGDTAVQADFTDTSGTLTFASGASGVALSQTFTVAAVTDGLVEGAETFTVTLSAPSGGFSSGISISDGTGTGTITAAGSASLSITDTSAAEGDDLTFTVTLSASPGAEVTVDYETSVGSGDTAVQADFTDTSGTLTFASGASGSGLSQTFTVAAADDALAEGAETFTVTLSAPSGGLPSGISISDGTGTGTIVASDAATLSVADASAAEGSNVTFTVTLSGSPSAAVTVDYATSVESVDTAATSDFTHTTGSVTFASGATGNGLSKTFTVATSQDSLAEGAETFTVTLTAPSGGFPAGVGISDGTGTGTITASDAATLSVNDGSAAEGSNLTFTVTLSGSPGAEVMVDYTTSVGSGDTAVQGDFTSTSGRLTFTAGATGSALSQTFTVAAADDSLAEGAETFTVTLTAPSRGFPSGVSISDGTGTGTIDASDAATLSVGDATGAEGSNLTFTVTLSGSPGAEVTVDYETSVGSGDTAVQADFTDTSGTLTFASGASGSGLSKTFTVAAADDALAEGAETFTVTLSAPSGGFPSGISISDGTGAGTIGASDAATLSVGDGTGAEGSNLTFAVTLSGSPGAEVTVDYETSVGSGDTAVQADFTDTSGTLTFASGASGSGLSKTFTVAAADDALAEGAETFTVTLSAPSGGFPSGISVSDGTGAGTIGASDPATLSVSDASGAEGSNLTFTVALSASPATEVTVDYATSVGSGDTAVQADFTDTSGTLTFASGASGSGLSKTFTVAAADDALAEGAETFTVTLSAPSGGLPANISISDSTGAGTINASDAATLSVGDASGAEGSSLTFTVTLSGSPGAEVTVDYATSVGGSDTAVQADFTSTTGTLTFASGASGSGLSQTFTVAAADDSLAEGAETLTVTLTAPSGGFPPGISISGGTGAGTISASDPATLSVGDATGAEGGNVTFTATLSGSPGAEVTVDYATSVGSGDTAVQADFTSTTGTLTFASGASGSGLSQTFTVATADDSLAEGAETFTVTLTAPSGGFPPGIGISGGTGVGTISASDPATLSVSDATGGEGGDLTFTVSLSGSPGAEVTVDYATSVGSGDTAVQADFTSTTGTLTFASGASGSALSQTFTVAATDDGLVEGDETFTVTLTAPSGGFPANIGISDGMGAGTIGAAGSASLSITDTSAAEGGALTFTVTLSASSGNEVTVDYATSVGGGDTAVQADFASTTGTLTFASGASGPALSQTFTVATTADDLVEGAETFTVTLTAPSGGFPSGISISDATGTGTISASGSAALSVTDASADEGSVMTFTVTLSGSPGNEVTVDYATSVGIGDTAVQADFASTSGRLTFAAGSTGAALLQTFTVAAADDALAEGPETFTVTLSEPSAGFPPGISLGDPGGEGTIAASDPATLSVSDASGGEGGKLIFTVTLSGSPGAAVTVLYATSIEAGDDASLSDFENTTGSLTFEAEATGAALSQTFAVIAAADSLAEGNETFTVTLSEPPGGFPPGISISDATGAGTITASGSATLSVSDASGDEGGDLIFVLTLSGSSAARVEVHYATSIGPDDTASESDLESVGDRMIFEAEATGEALSQTFTVRTMRDNLVEAAETFTVTLSAPPGGFPAGVRLGDATGMGTINASGAAAVSVSDASGSEGEDLEFTVALSASPASAVAVDYATGIGPDDTASQSDFENTSGRLIFEAEATGESLSQTFVVTAAADSLVEGDETFTVTLSPPSDGFPTGVSLGEATGQGTITASGMATLSVSDASGAEGGELTFTVSLSASPGVALTVDYATSVERGDTAVQADFTSTNGSLTFAAGATGSGLSQTFTVTAVDDGLVEGDETFTVTLSAPRGGLPAGVAIGDETGAGTIRRGGSAVLSVSDASGAEGEDLTFTVTLSASPGAPVTVDYATGTGPEDTAASTDFESSTGSLAFAVGAAGEALSQTFTVVATDDELAEGAETFTVSLNPSAGGFPFGVSIADGTGRGTIAASDAATVSIGDAAGLEGSELTFAVSLSGSPGADVEVAYATAIQAGDTAEVDDFAATNGTLRFAAGATGAELTRTFTVMAAGDSRAEYDETFSVTLSETAGGFPGGIDLGDVVGVGTIIEDVEASARARIGRVNEEVMPRLAQTVAASTVVAISSRIDSAAPAGSASAATSSLTDEIGLGGPFDPFNAPGSAWRYSDRTLGGLSFVMPLESSESEGGRRRGAAIWGSGDYYRLSDTDDSMVEWDGDVLNFHVGADMRIRPDLLAGVSVSRTTGSIEYLDGTDEVVVGGRHETQLTSMHPYVGWFLPERGLGLWATVGYGRGEVEVDDDLVGLQSSEMSMKTAAVGASGRLFSSQEMISGGTTSLRLKGEGSVAQLDIEGGDLISPLTSDVQRLRLALEGSYARTLDSGGMLTPSLELGVRHDGGDAVTGLGLELGGSLRYVESTIGLTVDGRGRLLVAHRNEEYEDWSFGGLVRLDPGADRHGLALTLAPAWGDGTGGVGSFGGFQDQQEPIYGRSRREVRQTGRVDAEIGYGLSGVLARGVVTPFGGLLLTDEGSRRYRLGSYIEFSDRLRFGVEAGREERRSRAPDHGVLLRAHLRW